MAIQLADETGTPVSSANPLPVEVVGAITLPAAVEVANDVGNPIPVSGTVTANTGLTQPLTDAQLRASAVPVSGPLTDAQLRASAVPVTGGLTDAQLRASAVPVSAASLPLPTGAATAANQDTGNAALASILSTLQAQVDLATTLWTDNSGAFYVRRDVVDQDSGTVVVSFTDPSGAAATPGAGLRPASNEESLATEQKIYTTINSGTGYSTGDIVVRSVTVDQNQSPPTVVTSFWLNLTTGAVISAPSSGHLQVPADALLASIDAKVATEATQAAQSALFGAVNETAPASDTASSGHNGRLQRIAQRITSLIALIPTSLGQKTKSASLAVTLASDSDPLPAGEAHIGQIGASTGVVSQTPTVSSSPAYSVGDAVGGLMTFASLARANDKSGYVQQAAVACKSAQAASLDLFIFNASPSGSTITDNAAFDLAAADFDKVVGVIHITDWTACGATRSFAQANNLAIPFKPASGTATLYGCLVARTTFTLASTSDLTVTLRAPQD